MEDILKRLADSSPNESSHELQCRCFDAADEISRLRNAIAETIEENGYLADGENCTLIKLKKVMFNVELRGRAMTDEQETNPALAAPA